MTLRGIAAFAIGPIGSAVLSAISLPVITWFFSQEDVGRMAMFQITLSFSVLLFSLGLDQSYVREFHEADNKSALLKHAVLPGLVLLVITVLVLLSFDGTLGGWLFNVPQFHLSVLVAIALVTSFISRFSSLVLRMEERGFAFSMSLLLPKLFLLLIIGGYVFVGTDKNLTNLLIANTVAICLVCIVYAWNTRVEWLAGIRARLNLDQLKSMLQFGLPLILGGLAFWGLTAIDKIFLRTLAGYEELAVYSVSVSFAAAASILQSVFSTVWAPTVYKWASVGEGLHNVHKVTRYILALVVFGFSLAGLFAWTIKFFLPANYASVQWIVVSCLGYPLLYTLSETTVVGISITRKTGFALAAALVAFLINILGNWIMIPSFGAAGASVSTCFSFWVFFVLRTEFSIRLWRSMPRMLPYGFSAIVVAGSIAFTLYGDQFEIVLKLFWLSVLMVAVLVFKTELKKSVEYLINIVKSKSLVG